VEAGDGDGGRHAIEAVRTVTDDVDKRGAMCDRAVDAATLAPPS
jgi:hypothetical protein